MDQLHPPNILPIIDPDKIEHTEAEPDGGPTAAAVLNVHAYDWTVKDMYGDDDHVSIHCWALDRFSKPYLLRFTDFPVFCQIELPMFVRNRVYQWRQAGVDAFMNLLSQRLGNDAPIRYVFRQAKKTYYYRGNRNFPMIQISFNNLKAMQHCSNLLNDPIKTDDWGFIKCNVWEDSISIVRKLLTVRDVRYSQWFSVSGHKVDPELRISTIENEYIAEWDTMEVIPQAQCSAWSTQPGVLAFDIECYSNNHRAMPDKYNAAHVAYMISCVFQRYRRPDTRRRYGIIIGDCDHIPQEKLENCTVIKVNTEYEMVVAFGRVVRETDPEILAGYNILSFDYPYLDHRVKRWLKQWPSMSRIDGEIPNMTSKTWQSGAYGHQSINILHLEGRISIDLLPIVKRDHKLEKYDLNTVCKKFVGKGKHDISAPEMFLIYEDMRNTLTVLVNIMKEAQDNPAIKESLEYAIRRRDAQQAFDEAKIETTRVLEYCIQDAELVIELMEKIHVWVGLVEMSNIVGVTITDLFTRGQQVRCLSQIYDKAARLGFVLDKRDVPGFKFTGGFVYEPIPGLYDNIICLDFASLYPSIMMAYNICYTTLVPPELEDLIPDEDCHVIEFDQDEVEGDHEEDEEDEEVLKEINDKGKKGGKTVKRHYRFKFYKKQEGLLPQLVRQMVAERRAVNRRIVQIKDESKILERTETVRTALVNYLNGTIQVQDVKAAAQRVKELSESNPPAKPEVITAAKRELAVAQLFNVAWTRKRLEDTPKTNQTQLTLAQLELEIAQLYEANDRDRLNVKLAHLQLSQEVRCLRIEDIKVEVVVLDKRQLALKVTANSFFGFLGVHTGGKMPLIEGAMSITAKGRELIGLVRRYIEQSYQGVQIYGDTDSVMMKLPQVKDAKECNYWGSRLSQEISGIKPGEKDCDGVAWPDGRPGLFPPPLAMEFEKAMRLLCLKKKKYAAYLVGKDGTFKTEDIMDRDGNVVGSRLMMLKKGIVLARRDNCGYLRKTYTRILDLIMNKGSLDDAVNVLVASIQELLDGKVPYQDLVVIRELGANYKSDSFFMKVFSDDLKKAGKIVNPGDRLDFVIVEDPTATLLGHKMRLTEQYLERLNSPNPERIDYNYYIEKALMNPINQLFEVGFKDDIAKLQHVSYKPTNRHKAIYLDRPVQIILKMRERGYDLKVFREAVRYNVMRLRGLNPVILNVTRPETVPATEPIKEVTKPVETTNPTVKPMIQLVVQPNRANLPTLPNLPNLPTLPPDKPTVPQVPQTLQTLQPIVQPRAVTLNLNPQQPLVAGKVPLTPALIMPKMALKTPRSSADSTNSTPTTSPNSPNSPLSTPVNTPPPTLNRQITLNIGGRMPVIPTIPTIPVIPTILPVPMLPASMLTLKS